MDHSEIVKISSERLVLMKENLELKEKIKELEKENIELKRM